MDEASSIVKLIPPSSEEMGKKIVKQVVPRKQETIREILQNYDDIDDFFYEDEDDSYFGYDPLDHTFFPQPVILRDLLPQRYSYLWKIWTVAAITLSSQLHSSHFKSQNLFSSQFLVLLRFFSVTLQFLEFHFLAKFIFPSVRFKLVSIFPDQQFTRL